jgi:subtilisin family serine protease
MRTFLSIFTILILFKSSSASSQEIPDDWHHTDFSENFNGISMEAAYRLLMDLNPTEVIVAVIDSGVDHEHEDLDEVMWVNVNEIPNNKVDDDNNGYVDDIHGWSFLGNPSGENVGSETLEETRIYAAGTDFPGSDEVFVKAVKAFHSSREEALMNLNNNERYLRDILEFQEEFENRSITLSSFEALDVREDLKDSKNLVANYLRKNGSVDNFDGLIAAVKSNVDYFKVFVDYYYNPEFDARNIVKDNYENQTQKYYGNNDSRGPDASHGTHVAGIIAAERENKSGIKGIANKVRIMSLRVVPDGDERDKDVANAIYYAVDNGAKVINMSFGKAFSWNKKIVDDAVKYAKRNDVLLVHASGNGAQELDGTNNFPNQVFVKRGLFQSNKAKNWLEVGAITYYTNENLVANFSNYGAGFVDLFAPGYQIYSTTPGSKYEKYNGTSMAAPMVSGVAALLRSYFPHLSAENVKEIIKKSARVVPMHVKRPSDKVVVPFNELSDTGAILNAEQAVKLTLSEYN